MFLPLVDNRKPTALIGILLGALLVVMLYRSLLLEPFFSVSFVVESLIIFVLYGFNIFIINRLDQQNSFSYGNSYFAFFFLCIVGLLPEVFTSYHYLLANLCVLLSIYQLLNITRGNIVEKAFLDASLLSAGAFLITQELILSGALVIFGIIIFTPKTYKNYFIPFFTLGVIALGIGLYQLYINEHYVVKYPTFGFYKEKFYNLHYLILLLGVFALTLVLCFFFYLNNKIQRPCYWLLLFMFPLGFLQELFTDDKLLGVLTFVALPLALYCKFVVEYFERKKIKQIALLFFPLLIILQWGLLKYS